MGGKKRGFTILEILVVLAVLAILIGIAVPRIKGMQEQANIAKVKSELKTIQLAVESYRINNGSYPDSDDDGIAFALTKIVLILEIPQIVPGVMYDPFGAAVDSEYFYVRSNADTNNNYYLIGSLGASTACDYNKLRDLIAKMGSGGCVIQEALDC
ncbi:MAG: prepilin-type N-terminal cleavage/methylation domain-containing protein, partial [Sphingobacteriia bacterium]|nr:prepilin-type N-terminal cleavage/methylation domain-containing protein [Sphingobacteriia bacterium]